MHKLLLTLFSAAIISVGGGFVANEAEAKRFGGGSSFGMKRNTTPSQPAVAPRPAQQAAAPAAAGAAAQAGKRSWLGPVAGLAAGLGLAALASHLGFGEEMASMMMILLLVVAAVFVYRLLTRSRQPQGNLQYAGAGQSSRPMQFESAAPVSPSAKVGAGETAISAAAAQIPADFDVAGFLRQAKLNFLRLQAANDRGDLEDIRNFTTPEVFAEVSMQFDERGRATQQTDVQQLDADLLAVVTDNDQHIASVHFQGALQEDGGVVENFAEVWHLAKPVDGAAGWRIAGIQQVA